MNSYERTIRFLQAEQVDHPPFHPIVMRWAAAYHGVPYREFCCNAEVKCRAMIAVADDFQADWVTTLSDPYCEAEAYGIRVEYPENDLPLDRGGHFTDLRAIANLPLLNPSAHARCRNRLAEVTQFRREVGGRLFIVGWVEGPIAEYSDLRGLTNASMDFFDEPDLVHEALDRLTENAKQFITAQVDAGADCIGIGDAFCSQIGPNLYRAFAFERQKQLVDHIHALGVRAKLHICGNTHALLSDMLATGADIVDVDHLVPSMAEFAGRLGPRQVFCGKVDPVSVVQNGAPDDIVAGVKESFTQAGGRCILSAGCEVTPGTSRANFEAFSKAWQHI
jgi:MtaA/CmuA family methyltransferase